MLPLMCNDNEPKKRIFRNRIDALSLYDDTFIDPFRLNKFLVKMICEEIEEDLCPVSDVHTALSVETRVNYFYLTLPLPFLLASLNNL